MPLETERLLLRGARQSDAAAYYEIWNSPHALQYNAMEPPSQERAQTAVQRDMASPTTFYLEEKAAGETIGILHLEEDSLRYRVNGLTLDYCLKSGWTGKGYMTEALGRLLAYVFDELQADVVSARVFEENLPSLRVLEKLGFVREGCLRWAVRGYGDIVHNDMLFSLLRSEYEAAKKTAN